MFMEQITLIPHPAQAQKSLLSFSKNPLIIVKEKFLFFLLPTSMRVCIHIYIYVCMYNCSIG